MRLSSSLRRLSCLLPALVVRGAWTAVIAEAQSPNARVAVDEQPTARLLTRDVSLRALGMREGLPQGTVIGLAVDRDGYVWGATFGGLFRFDGRQIIGFDARTIPALEGNAATAIVAGPDGSVYFASSLGLVGRMRDGQLIDSLPRIPAAFKRPIDDLVLDRAGTLFASVDKQVYALRGGEWSLLEGAELRGGLALDASGALLASVAQGISRERRGRWELLISAQDASRERPYGTGALVLDTQRRFWMARGAVLALHDGTRQEIVSGVDRHMFAMQRDAEGTLWIGALDGLYRVRNIDANRPRLLAEQVVQTRAAVIALAATADGAIVAGLRGDGFLLIRPTQVASVTFPAAEFRGELSSMIADGTGGLWLASGCSALAHVSSQFTLLDTIARPANGGCVRSIARSGTGTVWFGTDGYVRRRAVDGRLRDWALLRTADAVLIPRPLLVAGDTLWIGLSDGRIALIGPDDALRIAGPWSRDTGMPIESLVRAADGTMWVGQRGRITRWRDGAVTTFDRSVGVPSAVPRVLHPQGAGGVLIGTYGAGLLYLDPTRRARALPLVDNTVTSLIADSLGQYWMSGNRGLTVLDAATLRAWIADSTVTPTARLLSTDDGAFEANYGQPAATRRDDGRLVFAGTSGLMLVSPQAMRPQLTPPLKLDAVRGSRGFKALAAEIDFASDERVVDVYFSMPTYRYSDQVQFRYRLEGRDADWIRVGEERHIQLAGLRPGRVRLRLAGRVPGGAWREAQPVALRVAPMWWERGALQLLLLVGAIGTVTALVRQRLRAMQADTRAREVAVRAQRETAAMSERHQRELAQVGRVAVAGELTASLSHELGQPLAAIVNNAEVARRLVERARQPGGVLDPLVDTVLQDVSAQGRRASEVVREFRRFLRREAGARELLVIQELLDSTIELLRREYADAGVRLTCRVVSGTPVVEAERVLMQQVCVNLLQNALEAVRGRTGGEVLLRARPVAAGVRLSVADNGPGFPAAIRPTAFDPFVTARAAGMGMGLAIARRIVEAHGGRVAIGRLAGAGAVVSLWLPSATSSGRLDTVATVQVAEGPS